ncbi:MFS transporter [Streptosporangium sp. NBC_01639]|uniref:MFS transporter n=1 Tax=Streptosporangium sp. NBC_01639 TaxID=2975948 RepID=UPI003869D785|nr:MFS transporter [Streptosporangium sp. NBC_01639]
MTASLPFRLARAAVFAVVCLGLSVVAHRLGGGSVSAPVAAGGLLLAFGAAAAASGRERPLAVIFPLLVGLQAALHVLFSLSHAPAVHDAIGHAHTSGLAPSVGMLVAHAWAAGLTALWLDRGEAALWGLLRRLAVRLRLVLVAYLQPVHKPVAAVAAPEPGRLRSALLASAAPRRGPPHAQVPLLSG